MLENMKDYYFVKDINVNKHAQATSCNSPSVFGEQEIMLWHHKLGHKSFPYFKTLSRNKELVNLQCEACQLAKHSHAFKSFSTLQSVKTICYNMQQYLGALLGFKTLMEKNGLLLLSMITHLYVGHTS